MFQHLTLFFRFPHCFQTGFGNVYPLFVILHNHLMFDMIQAGILKPFKQEGMNVVGFYQMFFLPIRRKDILYQIFGYLRIDKTTSQCHQFGIKISEERAECVLISFLYLI